MGGALARLAAASRLRVAVSFVAAALLYELFALVAWRLTLVNDHQPTVWPANALTLALMILWHRRRADRLAAVAGAIAAGFLSSVAAGRVTGLSALIAANNGLEAWVAWALLARMGRAGLRCETASDILSLVFAALAAPAVSATVGAGSLWLFRGLPFGGLWLAWYVSCALGLLIVTPLVVTGWRAMRGRAGGGAPSRPVEATVILALVGLTAALVMAWGELRLLFLASPLVLLAAFRLRVFGASAATAIVAVAATAAIARDAITGTIGQDQVLLLQVYLASIFLCALPVAAVLAERDAKAAALSDLARRYRDVVESVGDVIFRTDPHGRWTYLNPAWTRVFGLDVDGSIGRSSLGAVHKEDRVTLLDRVRPLYDGTAHELAQVLRAQTGAGAVRWIEVLLRPIRDGDGHVVGLAGTLRDIDDRKRLEESIAHAKRRAEAQAREAALLAATDDLTGLANRRSFLRHLGRATEEARGEGRAVALAIFDVDHFKSVNDRFGHGVGDAVLRLVAARAVSVIRGGDLVGRIGGEEFGILMPGASLAAAEQIAERFRRVIEVAPDDPALPAVTVSVGLAVLDGHGAEYDLLADADRALYEAKRAGRNCVRVARPAPALAAVPGRAG